jgi:hypothetical protein
MGFPGQRSPYPASGPYPYGYWSPWGGGGGPGPFSGRVVTRVVDANFLIPNIPDDSYVFMSGLTVTRTVTLPAAPTEGQIVEVKDEDGSLATPHDIVIAGNGNTIDGAASYTMTLNQNGNKGSVALMFTSAGWSIL